ncbi:hypothetical protein K438DRAFT_2018332 [Mycena galopus ATCC 62051]|nr:hypothetical protein K438DRAFT_2018332 [Mycena galopus ATCC 62051]
MTGIELLVPELLTEIMFRLPADIDQKFAVAQVSRFWRNVALDSHLFWSSFAGESKADLDRLPLLLERSGPSTMLHVQFCFRHAEDWSMSTLRVLVPYVARIETLEMKFFARVVVTPLLCAGLEFPALRTLYLHSASSHFFVPTIWLTAPQLRTLDIERISLKDCAALLSPSLKSVRLWGPTTSQMFLGVLNQCPQVSRIALESWDPWYSDDPEEDVFEPYKRRPLAPSLRELELQLYEDSDLSRVLKTGFSDAVLHTLKGCIYNGHREDDIKLLADALLPGVGALVSFTLVDMRDLQLHDAAGHIRHLQCWNGDSHFEVRDVWKYLSIHYALHTTVCEIRMHPEHWHEYLEIFELYPPQLQDGITLAIETGWMEFPQIQDDDGEFLQASRILRMPGLAKVKFCGAKNFSYFLQTISDVLALIEPPTGRRVEVCVELGTRAQDALIALQSTLLANSSSWVMCSHCRVLS